MEYIQLKEQVKQELPVNVEIEEEDNLLELGLDSLKIMRLVNTWRKQGIRIYSASLPMVSIESLPPM